MAEPKQIIGQQPDFKFPEFNLPFRFIEENAMHALTDEERVWFHELFITEFIYKPGKIAEFDQITKNWKKDAEGGYLVYDVDGLRDIDTLFGNHWEMRAAVNYLLDSDVSHLHLPIPADEELIMELELEEKKYEKYHDKKDKIRAFLTEKVEGKAIDQKHYHDVLFALYRYKEEQKAAPLAHDKYETFYKGCRWHLSAIAQSKSVPSFYCWELFHWCFRKFALGKLKKSSDWFLCSGERPEEPSASPPSAFDDLINDGFTMERSPLPQELESMDSDHELMWHLCILMQDHQLLEFRKFVKYLEPLGHFVMSEIQQMTKGYFTKY